MNFMIDEDVAAELKMYVEDGQRSDFINQAAKDALVRFQRKIAFEHMDKLANELNLKMTTEEIIEAKNYGRN